MLSLPSDEYFAGFLDGEGCFRWACSRPGHNGGTPRICISNTYRPILDLYQQRFGGTVILKQKATKKWRTCFEWYCTGDSARACIRATLPYLLEKQEQARLVLQASEVHSLWRGDFIQRIKDLKKLDYK